MSVTIKSGSHTVTWEDGELTGSSKLVKTLQAAARFNFHRGVDLLPTGPTWDITLGDARGTAALATYLQLPWDSDEIDLGEGCVPDLDLDVEPTPFWPKNKKIAKSQGLAIAKHGDGSHDDKDHGNRHTHVVTPTGKVGTIHDSTRAADWMAEYLDTEELANAVYAMKVEVGDSTWETQITSTGIQNATLGPFQQVKGDIIKDGSKVGHFWHSLRPDKNSAHLGAIYIESEHQGTGAGSMIVAHWEDELAGLGIKEVTLETVEIGRYAWALAGFDFKSPADREAVRSAAASAARLLRYSGTSIPSELNDELRVVLESDFSPLDLALVGFNHPWRGKAVNHQVFSEFTEIKGTHHLGKALMLSGPGWDGKKTLTQLAKSLTAAGLVWREWALDNPAAVESDDPEFLKELADALAGKITKSLSPNFGKRNRRQANLMSKLRGARNYAKPVRGGTGAQQRTRRSKFAKGLGLDSTIAKHADHDQSTHGNRNSSSSDYFAFVSQGGDLILNQLDGRIQAYSGGTPIGGLRFRLIEQKREVHVSEVEVDPVHRRKGVGRLMVETLKKDYPGWTVESSTAFTREGAAFWSSVTGKEVTANPFTRMGKHGNHDQKTHGNWADSHPRVTTFSKPRVAHLDNSIHSLPSDVQDKMRAHLAKEAGSIDSIKDRLRSLLDSAATRSKAFRHAAQHWYDNEHAWASDLADANSLPVDNVIAATATMSSGLEWEKNKSMAELLINTAGSNPTVASVVKDWAAVKGKLELDAEKKGIDHPPFTDSTRFNDLHPRLAAIAFQSISTAAKDPYAARYGYLTLTESIEVLRGDKTMNDINGMKRRSFYNNLLALPEDNDVTIDVQMFGAVLGRNIGGKENKKLEGRLNSVPSYLDESLGVRPLVADLIRELTDEYNSRTDTPFKKLLPRQTQSIIWAEFKEQYGRFGEKR